MASTLTVDKIKGGSSGVALTLPTTDGSAGQLLKTNGSAVLSWATDIDTGITSVAADATPQLGGMLDVNGKAIGDGTLELLKFSETASAVNELTIANAATGNAPVLSATGGDTNIDITLTPKGTGNVVLGGDLDCNGAQIQWSKGADVVSATALPVLTDGNYFDVTGTTTVTSINTTGGPGTLIKLHFNGILILTNSVADLILPGGANITTAAGDEAEFIEYAAGDYRCTSYSKASGEPVVSAAGGKLLQIVSVNSSTSISLSTSSFSTVLTVNITPTSTTSKFLVTADINGIEKDASSNYMKAVLFKGSSQKAEILGHHGYGHSSGVSDTIGGGSLNWLDPTSASDTTTAINYNIQARRFDGSGTVSINMWNSATSALTVMEIEA